MLKKSNIFILIVSQFASSGKTEQTFNYPPLVALDTYDANGIQIFKRHIISKEGLWSWSSMTWSSSEIVCRFYKNTINGNHFYLMLINNPKQWQIFENLSESEFGCPSSDTNKLLFYNHLGEKMLKSEGWLDNRKGKSHSNEQSVNVYDLNKCSSYTEDKIETKHCSNKNPDHCEIVLSKGENDRITDVINKCFRTNQRSPRHIEHDDEFVKADENPGFPYIAVTGCVVGGFLLVYSVTYLLLAKKRSQSDPGPKYIQRGEDIENHHNIFIKGEDLKLDLVHSAEDERRFEDFQKLEDRVAHYISPVKSTAISQKEKNAKHNRYRDIGKL